MIQNNNTVAAFTAATVLLSTLQSAYPELPPVIPEIASDHWFLSQTQVFGQQLVGALLWMQQSAEYRAAVYQAFNYARLAFKAAPEQAGQEKTIIIDIDETLLDNTPFEAGITLSGVGYQQSHWENWEREGKPQAIAGALEFLQDIDAQGGKIYYLSNRYGINLEPTIAHLQHLGFPQVERERVILQYVNNCEESKDQRLAHIMHNEHVVLIVGDSIDDFYGTKSLQGNAAKRQWVDENADLFGTKYIMLPNPVYGSWMANLATDFYSLPQLVQNQIAINALITWDLEQYLR
ncbi:5'-nucleotidase, lipoprotein e(P4) family [Psittacicella hinzii]|uniref:5'-nucleotidase, lipoprotein e(P4) family n=1 Tax=Psittacicella hinzii TaxID=2028575 RepID=A0A3A1YPC9_9GAMM|nr:HAD family acid phosphatase [Psittacicella hinzii]RIY39088.1 hypothetical protein CKF58_02840 [Psittacicella hinzii]